MKPWEFYAAFILVVVGLFFLLCTIVDASHLSPRWPEMPYYYFLFALLSFGFSVCLLLRRTGEDFELM